MTAVYLATAGEYSDYRVLHVFARREDAEAYPLRENDVEERELHDGPVQVRDWHELTWSPGKPEQYESYGYVIDNPGIEAEPRDFDGRERWTEHEWNATHAWLEVRGWDRQAVLKVYSEQRAQYLARQEAAP